MENLKPRQTHSAPFSFAELGKLNAFRDPVRLAPSRPLLGSASEESEVGECKWNFWRLSGHELARNEIFLRHKSRGTGAGLVEVQHG